MRGTGPRCDLSEAKFKVWIPQHEREDLALLLRAQDWQEGRRRLSIHYLKNTLQFADTWSGPALSRLAIALLQVSNEVLGVSGVCGGADPGLPVIVQRGARVQQRVGDLAVIGEEEGNVAARLPRTVEI